ncbi:hypothetical protein [Polaribacter sp. Hel_I_88]|uniref:hypothetical protein n=1 Tax=Polaribacter sp. Hel_I_88 TaxID=1250006 RepID=UPI00047E4B6F|nr:hypothetical protein [Polaribacter sp. Hel_I_88]
MVKKIFGAIFILISVFLGILFLIGIPNNLSLFLLMISSKSAHSIGYFTGNFIIYILILVISIKLFKLGLKWTSKKPNLTKNINKIGINK